MELPEKDQMITKSDEKDKMDLDELIIFYYYKCCSFMFIIFTIFSILFIWFPVFLIVHFCIMPHKRVVIIDEINKILIICDKGMIPCCKLNPKTYFLDNIKKVIIYITTKPDPKIGFKKLYFVNCIIVSLDGQEETLFKDIGYENDEKLNEIITYFRRHFDTEFRPEDVVKVGDISKEDNNIITTNSDDNYIANKPSINDEAAMPIFA